MKGWILFGFLLFGAACSRYPPSDSAEIAAQIGQKVNAQVDWYRGGANREVQDRVQYLLTQEMTPEITLQIAFLNNPKVQAIFENLGISEADLLEAGLLSNPNFAVEFRYPQKKGFVTNIEYLVTATFLDIFQIPLRKRVATAEYAQLKRRVTFEILTLAFEVRKTTYELLAQKQKLNALQPLLEIAFLQSELAIRQNRAGNINPLDFQLAQAHLLEAQVELDRERRSFIHLREKLNELLGLCKGIELLLPPLPAEVHPVDQELSALETLALNERMDLQELYFEVVRLRIMLGLKEWWNYTQLQTGLAGERDPDRLDVVGFGVAGAIPIFNYGQGARARLNSQLWQAQDNYAALNVAILAQVRDAFKTVQNTLRVLQTYREGILPVQEKISLSSEALYDSMGMGVDRLLGNKRLEWIAYRNYLDALETYWLARVELDEVVGGGF